MRIFKQSFFAVLTSLLFAAPAMADASPTLEPVSFDKIYTPDGFDSNDNVQIVGEGVFSNSCYRHAETKVWVDHEKMTIRLGPVAYKYGGYCLQVILPYDRTVDIGILNAGTYKIVQSVSGRSLGTITIKPATTLDPDDYLYSPVSQALVQSKNGKTGVYLMGDFPLSCMKMKEVKFQVQPDVLVVQPISEIDPSQPCVQGKFPFSVNKDVGAMNAGRYLLHVRSINGKAINNLFDVSEPVDQ